MTTAGEHDLTLYRIRYTAPGEDSRTYRRPIEDVISFDGKKKYQQGISLQGVDRASTLSYRDAAADCDGILTMPSRSTIHRSVKRYGRKLGEFLPERLTGKECETVIADGRKCHSQEAETCFNDIHVTLGESPQGSTRSLLDVSLDTAWEETATSLAEIDAVTDDTSVVSDSEREVVGTFTDDEREHQLDLVHVGRTLGHKLWDDGVFEFAERESIVTEVQDELFHLKNSVEKHRPLEEYGAIRERIATTKDRLVKTTWQLAQQGSLKAAS